MPVEVIWDDDAHTIIRQIYSGNVDLRDYITATDVLEQMAKHTPYVVHSLMDRTQVLSAPNGTLTALRYANNHVPENLGLRVIIKGDSLTKVLVEIGKRIAPRLIRNIYFVDTVDDGRLVIDQHRAEFL